MSSHSLGRPCGILLAPFGAFPRIVGRGDRIRVMLGVVLEGVEADLVAVAVVQVGRYPADTGPVHLGVLLASVVNRAASCSIASLPGTPMAK